MNEEEKQKGKPERPDSQGKDKINIGEEKNRAEELRKGAEIPPRPPRPIKDKE